MKQYGLHHLFHISCRHTNELLRISAYFVVRLVGVMCCHRKTPLTGLRPAFRKLELEFVISYHNPTLTVTTEGLLDRLE